jgi:hypothetical protein
VADGLVTGVGEASVSQTVGCAVATVSYLARARVAAESWRQHHPDSPFVVLLIDGQEWPRESEPFKIVLPEDLGLASEELAIQQGIYTAFELSCALKPPLFRLLLDQGASAIVFTDTDTFFYAPVEDVARSAESAGLALIPHATKPPTQTARYLPLGNIEYRQFVGGLFNLGFIAVGDRGRPFLDWWGARLARDCLTEPTAGMYVDERWVDWAPVYFDHVIVRDSSLNVAFWNLDGRELHDLDGKPAVDGAPLRLFHFAGFDPRNPERLTKYVNDAWPPPPPNPTRTRLLHDYAKRLLASGSADLLDRPYKYGLSAGGRQLGLRERAVYREAVLAAEARGTESPPSPFDPSRTDEFDRLVDEPASLGTLSSGARARLELVRPPGVSHSSFARLSGRLLPAARYALLGSHPPGPDVLRVESDVVRREY